MRAIWKGTISFGLVTMPVGLFPAVKKEELKFRLLRQSDLSPIDYKRVAEFDGKEVPWAEIVKGYEYEKGKYVVLRDEDFKRVDIEATDSIDILDFVKLDEINPMFFYKPYYLAPTKGGSKPYSLLRVALKETGKVGIAKVVIRTKQHLAALKSQECGLVLELMHFGNELLNTKHLDVSCKPAAKKREINMAKSLINSMTEKWDPSRYTDDYSSALMNLIQRKIESGDKSLPPPAKRKEPTKIINLVDVLQQSLNEAQKQIKQTSGHRTHRKRKAA
ncbi:MAG: Ku protein [Verrucomicrobiae bacterium]|nr:Ku protein [Verrucomicrobiae bacterium]